MLRTHDVDAGGHKKRQANTLTAYTQCYAGNVSSIMLSCCAVVAAACLRTFWLCLLQLPAFQVRVYGLAALQEEVHRHIKSVVQPRFTARMEGPHHGAFAPGYFAVTTSGSRVEGAFAKKPTYKRLALHHYVVKSREDFEEKMARGNVMGEESRQESFWQQIESQCVQPAAGRTLGVVCSRAHADSWLAWAICGTLLLTNAAL